MSAHDDDDGNEARDQHGHRVYIPATLVYYSLYSDGLSSDWLLLSLTTRELVEV